VKVEFFRLLDSHAWDTFVEELPPIAGEIAKGGTMLEGCADWESVPDDVFDEWVRQFIHEDLITQCQHRRALVIAVFRRPADNEDRDEEVR
jgi:hypothetical protein